MFMVLSQIRKTPCNVATHCTQVVLNSSFLSKNVSHFSPQARLFLTVPTSMACMYIYFRFFGLICTDRSCHCGTNLTEKVSNQKITSYFTVNRGILMKYLFEINDFDKQKSRSPGKSRPKISKNR